MAVRLPTEHHLEFLSLTGDCTGSSEYTIVKMPHCWKKSHVASHLCFQVVKSQAMQMYMVIVFVGFISCDLWAQPIPRMNIVPTTKTPSLSTISVGGLHTETAGSQPVGVFDNDNTCVLKLDSKSVQHFRHVTYKNFGYVFLRLHFTNGLELHSSKYVVGGDVWIWTYFGQNGGREFLRWPMEFGIWSMGILYTFVGGPFDMELHNVSGNCSNLQVGDNATDYIISKALVNLTEAMIAINTGIQREGPSFWCYRQRALIRPEAVYNICKHIICPVKALEHVCRSYFYNPQIQHRELSHNKFVFKYDALWWIGPFFIAILLFVFSPLLLLCIANSVNTWLDNIESVSSSDPGEYIFLDGSNHVTLSKTLLGPLIGLCKKKWCIPTRIFRGILPWFSLSIIGLQILLDYHYLHDAVLVSIDEGVPMGFRSMLAGNTKSSENFLPYLGGPIVACTVYLMVTSVLVIIPKSLPKTLESGLSNKDLAEGISPLSLRTPVLERYGSVLIAKHHGYNRIYNFLIGQCYLLLNINFWKLVIHLQIIRGKPIVSRKFGFLFLPVYVILCLMEQLLCLLLYSVPMVSFVSIIFRAYSGLLYRAMENQVRPVFIWLSKGLLIVSILFSLFMFCTIFLDACVFVSRLCIFTYTGVLVYPKVAYGYLIFVATIIYYFFECIQNYSSYYTGLLRVTVSMCESIQIADDTEPLVVRRSHCKGISARLFDDVKELYCPQRKKVFISLLQMAVIVCILGISVHMLYKTHRFEELHAIMHVGTVLFICAFPKILKLICCPQGNRYSQRRQKAEIKIIIRRCLEYFSDEEDIEVE